MSTDDVQQDGEEFVVERIDGKRRKKGKLEYFIKWKNFNESENTWEPEKNCRQCKEAIADFERREAVKKDKKSGKRASSKTPAVTKKALKEAAESDSASASTTASKKESAAKETPAVDPEAEETAAEVQESVMVLREISPEPIEPVEAMEAVEEAAVEGDVEVVEQDEPNSSDASYGISKAAVVQTIVGVSNLQPNELMVIVQYTNGGCEAVPSRLLKEHCPGMLIDFYESKLNFDVLRE
ncbi:hypothetical protein L596_025871 [Steinernema carpocapsae]|uniref:Chromo domain-containing protein n=1 Tax=Steinernema carpocapsae TaxID=34508 RepID=A0A4U5M933_STECR|nr:hypothetical protein L596_025871 [Steinernema carpocapsae]